MPWKYRQGVIDGLEWCRQPTELVIKFETDKAKTENFGQSGHRELSL
jgi:hypothetical protein